MTHVKLSIIIGMDPAIAKHDLAWLHRKDDRIIVQSMAHSLKLFSKFLKKHGGAPKDLLLYAAQLRVASSIRRISKRSGTREYAVSGEEQQYAQILAELEYAKPKRKRAVADFMASHAHKILEMSSRGYSSRNIASYFQDSPKYNIDVSHTSIANFIRANKGA